MDANKFSFVWRKATNRYEAALDKQSNEFYQTLYKEEIAQHLETELVATEEQLQKEKKKEKQSQLKKKKNLQKYLRKIQADYLPRKQRYETYNRLFSRAK